jgi:hypothetical protein
MDRALRACPSTIGALGVDVILLVAVLWVRWSPEEAL